MKKLLILVLTGCVVGSVVASEAPVCGDEPIVALSVAAGADASDANVDSAATALKELTVAGTVAAKDEKADDAKADDAAAAEEVVVDPLTAAVKELSKE